MLKKILCCGIVVALLTTSLFAQQQGILTDYVQGKVDGERDGKSDVSILWMGAGCCLYGLGIVMAFVISPSVPAEKLMGKTSDYSIGYADGYKSGAKQKQAIYAATGCVLGSITLYLIYALAFASTFQY